MPVDGFFEKMLKNNQITLRDGHVEEFGVRMVFLPAFTVSSLIERLYERHGDEAFDLLFEVGRDHGRGVAQSVGHKHKIKKKQFMVEMIESANALGLGQITVESHNPNTGRFAINVTDSPVAQELAASDIADELDRPVNALLQGMGQGVLEAMYDAEVTSEETHCSFLGDQHCTIVYRTDMETG